MTRLFLALLVLFSINVHAQQYTRTILGDSVNKSTKLKAERFKTMWDGKIKGKRYYNETFILGKVNDESYYLRYDQYADQFEAKRQQEQEAQNLERELSKVVTYDSLNYFFLPYYYKNKKQFNVGYLNLLLNLDTLKIYGKNEVTFRPATFSPTTIEIGFPPRYIHRKLFFVQRMEETPIQISKRKLNKLFETLPLEPVELKSDFLN
ncbi:hypothetical protein N9I15_02785 [Flavobacteriaceae bacterium]|jgi:hypothetical protein|nr:hypothetical protein [Flavobacteriaceae bacterium]MDA9037951.1 hypothetical protein [Flavobacteriaceae bacterium]